MKTWMGCVFAAIPQGFVPFLEHQQGMLPDISFRMKFRGLGDILQSCNLGQEDGQQATVQKQLHGIG